MKPDRADQTISDALRKLVAAGRADGAEPETKQTALRAVGKRCNGFLRGIFEGAELARLTLVGETKAYEYLDPKAAKAGLRLAQLPLLDPTRFRAAMAWAIETHRAVWGDELAPLTREQVAMLALAAMGDASKLIAESMLNMHIDNGEAREQIPALLNVYRKVRALLVAHGIDPDADEAGA